MKRLHLIALLACYAASAQAIPIYNPGQTLTKQVIVGYTTHRSGTGAGPLSGSGRRPRPPASRSTLPWRSASPCPSRRPTPCCSPASAS